MQLATQFPQWFCSKVWIGKNLMETNYPQLVISKLLQKEAWQLIVLSNGFIIFRTSSHIDVAEKNNIHLYCLPSNITYELQPLDKSVFRSFETYWDEEVLLFWKTHHERKLTKELFGKIFSAVLRRAVTPANIVNGFKACGVFPFNDCAIPDYAFAPGDLTSTGNKGTVRNWRWATFHKHIMQPSEWIAWTSYIRRNSFVNENI